MFSKSFIVVALLAAFAVQGLNAKSVEVAEARESRALGDLIDKAKELIENIKNIVTDVVGNAANTIGGLKDTIKEIREKYLQEGLEAIGNIIGDVRGNIKDWVEQAKQLGIDISECIDGRDDELEQLRHELAGNFTGCISTTVENVLDMVNADLETVHEIAKDAVALPANLTKCLGSLRPITCVTEFIKDLTGLVSRLPGQVKDIVQEALKLVESLPESLIGCSNDIGIETARRAQAIAKEISECVAEKGVTLPPSGSSTSTAAPSSSTSEPGENTDEPEENTNKPEPETTTVGEAENPEPEAF